MKRFSGTGAARVAGALLFFVMYAPAAGAATITVNCDMGELLQAAIDGACSGDRITVTGTCNEAVIIGFEPVGCNMPPTPNTPFQNLSISGRSGKKGATGTTIEGVGGPAITVNSNAIRISIKGLTVGSDTDHGIAILSAHRVTLTNIRTPSPLATPLGGDGVNVDTLSTNTKLTSSTLNGNGGDGVEMGATNGSINNVTANDNMEAGIHVTGDNVKVERCTAHNTATLPAQQVGFQVDGATAVIQKSIAQNNTVAQYHNTLASRGVILFRNTAGDSRVTVAPASGKGVWEQGSGNYISNFTVTRNGGDGVHLAGDGNQLQRSSVFGNVGAQVRVEGDRNLLTSVSATRLGPGDPFESMVPAYNVMAGSQANFFIRTNASVDGTAVVGDGFSIPDLTTTGERNTRRPTVVGDPPAALK